MHQAKIFFVDMMCLEQSRHVRYPCQSLAYAQRTGSVNIEAMCQTELMLWPVHQLELMVSLEAQKQKMHKILDFATVDQIVNTFCSNLSSFKGANSEPLKGPIGKM